MDKRHLTDDEMWNVCYNAALSVAQQYGITDVNGFAKALMAVSDAEGVDWTTAEGVRYWDSQISHDNGKGWGLFAEHDQGYAGYLTPEQRKDPQQNANAAAKQLGQVWKDSDPIESNITRMTGPLGQNPQLPQVLAQRAIAAVSGLAGATANAAASQGLGGFTPMGTQGNEADFIQWLKDHGFGGYIYTNPKTGVENVVDAPDKLLEAFLGTSGLSPEESAETGARTGLLGAQTAQIGQEMGGYAANVSLDEREQKRKEIETEISAGTLEWNKGVDKFNAWLNATGEARMRAEKEMEQKEWQLPTKYFPGTEPGGMLAKVSEGYGLPFTPLEGQPVTPESSAEGVYNKWQGNMGAPLQAPSFPGNGGSATPTDAMGGAATQLAGPSETQNFIQELLRKHALRVGGLPGMAGGGFMPEHRPFIAGERGPEVIQPTNTGTAVTPIVGPGGENPESMAQQHRPDYRRLLENHHRRRSQVYQRWQASGRF